MNAAAMSQDEFVSRNDPEALTEQQAKELIENDLLNEWLGESRFTAQIVGEVDDALAILAAKRTTLEEKIIRKELHTLVANLGSLLERVHTCLATDSRPPLEALEQYRTLNFRIHAVIGQLLKALRYNLNYVEQYFEYDFASRLVNEEKFADEAARVLRLLTQHEQTQ